MRNALFVILTFFLMKANSQKPLNISSRLDINNVNVTYVDILESVALDLMTEEFIGESMFNSKEEFDNECKKRIESKYTQNDIIELKERIPSDFILQRKSKVDIYNKSIEFTTTVYIPKTTRIRTELIDKLTAEELDQIDSMKRVYQNTLEEYSTEQKVIIRNDSNLTESKKIKKLEELELHYSLLQLTPTLRASWYNSAEEMEEVTMISSKYSKYVIKDEEEYIDLIKQRIKISYGGLANLVGLYSSYKTNREKMLINFANELLMR